MSESSLSEYLQYIRNILAQYTKVNREAHLLCAISLLKHMEEYAEDFTKLDELKGQFLDAFDHLLMFMELSGVNIESLLRSEITNLKEQGILQ